MATLSIVILKNKPLKDGSWNVKVKLGHKSKEVFLETLEFVGKKQLDKEFKIKDQAVISTVYPKVEEYRQRIKQMGENADLLTATQIKEILLSKKPQTSEIDFLSFCKELINQKINQGKEGSISGLKTVVNSLMDYFKTPTIPISDINYNFLVKYERYLRSYRKFTRVNHDGEPREYSMPPIGDAGLHNHMRDLRLMFNEARNHFNDEDAGIIRIMHYPFKKYKISAPPLTEHRDKSIEELRIIRNAEIPVGTRAELARDLFMLSFFMCGMNAADLYELDYKTGDRITYNRAKTRNKRKDKAFISVKVTKEAKPLLKRYSGELQKRYSATSGLNHALDKGLKELAKITGVQDLDFYSARHSFGTLARNACGFSTEDVAAALNHKERTVTDIYIAPDWSVVDKVQKAVAELL